MKRKHRFTWVSLILPSALGIAFIAACIWGKGRSAKAEEYKKAVKSIYSGAYSGLAGELTNLEVSLSKLQIVGTRPQYILLLDDVWHSCGTCSGYLAQIPASHEDCADISAYIARTGAYARTLAEGMLHGKAITDNDLKQLSELRKAAAKLSERVTEHYKGGRYPDEILTNDGYFGGAKYTDENSRQSYPTLIYDGPFSESAEKAKPKGDTGERISETRAYTEALKYLPASGSIAFSSVSDGDIPAYDFSGRLSDGREIDISVTQKGGKLLWFMTRPTGNGSGKPSSESIRKYEKAAKEYLAKKGYESMTSTYAQFYDGMVLINFAFKQGNVTIYNDLIKVWIDRRTSGIIGCDTRNYIFSHTDRELDEPSITKKEAGMLISENLKVEKVSLALIPTSPEHETLCYEFKGRYAGDSYIVYINAQSGEEQQIFRIINTEEGELVI